MQCDELSSAIARYRQLALSTQLARVARMSEAPPQQGDRPGHGASAWQRYGSINNCSNERELQCIRAAVTARFGANCEWIATEKVHGANFCFETDGQRIEYASRTQRLCNNADFFNARETMPKYHSFVREAFCLVRQRVPSLTSLCIYGEYFGGYYPGHSVEAGRKKVQGGVAYSPGHHFYAFDVNLDGQNYMNFDEARALLLAAGFPLVAAPLRRGPLEKLLEMDVEVLVTSLPAQLGHPPLERFCIAEGIVLRPAVEVRCGGNRAIIKKKAKAFWEATNQPSMIGKASSATGAFSGLDCFLDVTKSLVTENRLRAVISKDPGLLAENNLRKLAGLFAQDILEELEKCQGEDLKTLDKEVSVLKRSVQFLARSFVVDRVEGIRLDVG
mmetsp:Transcript_38577/g.81991  ORF Transcript_38577/g.81991 Transcript_38577/m.81991 type:complete len:388 (+) Transcript_38577:38-1201(+)